MQQYAVHHMNGTPNPVIVLQYPGLETSGLVIVAPMVDASDLPEIAPLTPILEIEDRSWMVLTYRMAAIPTGRLGEKVAVLDQEFYLFQRALSRLFFGN